MRSSGLKNLDLTNPRFLRPSAFSWVGALLLFLLALVGIGLAYGPVPDIPLHNNPIVLSLFFVIAASLLLFILPPIFNWGWKARNFGFTGLCLASVSLLAVVPCLVLFLYGKSSYVLDVVVAVTYVVTHIVWCRRFFKVYSHIFKNKELRDIVYREELDAVYYSQRADKYLLEKFYKFSQEPRARYFVGFLLLALFLIPFTKPAKVLTGLPFAHLFLIIGALPISWMCIGFAFRSFLIFYYYPAKIMAETGKDVYVDLVGSFQVLERDVAKHLKKTVGNF